MQRRSDYRNALFHPYNVDGGGGRSQTWELKRATWFYGRGNGCSFMTQRNALIADGDSTRLTFEQLIIINLNIREVRSRKPRTVPKEIFYNKF